MTATRPLGSTGIAVTAIGFGAGPLGGFYGAVDAKTGAAAARRAYDLGVRYFDVAPLYGHGRAELVLGHALRDLPRDDIVVSTKIGRYLVPAGVTGAQPRMREEGAPFNPVLDYSRDGTLRALEQSMQRLGMARIDLVYIHDVDAHSQGSESAAEAAFRSAMEGALPALVELKRAGVIRAIGIGLNQPDWALRWVREAELDAVMIAGRMTLLNREAEAGLIDECRARGTAVVAAGAFNGGLLARGVGGDARFNYRPASEAVLQSYERMAAYCRKWGVDMKAAAIQFVLRNPAVTTLVIGAASPMEVEENMRLAEVDISQAFWASLPAP
jgi:D-threo-aldose 1-dehydrogenase